MTSFSAKGYIMIKNELDLSIKYELNSNCKNWPTVCGIYAIYSKSTGKVYVGMTQCAKGFYSRWIEHRKHLRANKGDNIYLQRAYNKYREKDFYFKVLEIISPNNKKIFKREWYWIRKLKSTYSECGYNAYTYENDMNKLRAVISHKISNKSFKLINPEGKIVTFRDIGKFCRKNGIDIYQIKNLIAGKNYLCNGFRSIHPKFNKKWRKIVSPEGEVFEFDNIEEFCKEHNLSINSISVVLYGKVKQSHGWKLPSTKLNRSRLYLINFCKSGKFFQYVFMFNRIKYRGGSSKLNKTISLCENKLKELGANKQLRRFLGAVKNYHFVIQNSED